MSQADRPQHLSITFRDQDYTLTWAPAKQKYCLHLHHLPRLRDTYYGPDPDDAKSAALARLPELLTVQPKPKHNGELPKYVELVHKGEKYRLALHRKGEYRKQIAGQDRYFGRTPAEAEKDFYARIDGILAGRDPRFAPATASAASQYPTFDAILDDALAYKASRVGIDMGQARYDALDNKAGKIKECAAVVEANAVNSRTKRMLSVSTLDQIDPASITSLLDKLRETHNLTTLNDDLQLLRFAFKRANKRYKLDHVDLIIEEGLKSVPQDKMLAEQQENQSHYEREEILALLEHADNQWKAKILLGINGAMEPKEIARLDWSFVDLKLGWYGKQRSKRAGAADTPRLFWYWPETREALLCQSTRGQSGLVFLTQRGNPWIDGSSKRSFHVEFTKLETASGVKHVPGRGFYGLRHSFRTYARQCKLHEKFALDIIMGHKQKANDMSRRYEGEGDDFIVRHYCEFTWTWLYHGMKKAHELSEAWMLGEGANYLRLKFQTSSSPAPGAQPFAVVGD